MKVAILYICTGKYDMFWEKFYESCEKKFLLGANKMYYVFTDAQKIYQEKNSRIKKIYQENLGWPGNTLFRFKMFQKYIEELRKCDYIFFFNANVLLLEEIGMEILPQKDEILVVKHPGFFNKNNLEFTYERNPKSLAYIPYGKGKFYVFGAFNGGTGKSYTEMICTLDNNIEEDYSKNIIAIWHDESHLNHYILNHRFKIMGCDYAYPEGWEIPFKKKILIRDKSKFGGHQFLRGVNRKWYKKLFFYIKKCFIN